MDNNTDLHIDILPTIADTLLVTQQTELQLAFGKCYRCNQSIAGNNQELPENAHAFMDGKRQINLKNVSHCV